MVDFRLLEESKKSISRFDAEILLAHLLGVSRAELYIYDDDVSDELIAKFNNLVQERSTGRPLQYILGKAGFMGLEFIVTPDVFIPRPETELLVEGAINLVGARLPRPYNGCRDDVHILDLGTGSGNIAISLTNFIANCKIIASDVSDPALCVAKENAKANLVDKKVNFVLSDMFENLSGLRFDIIISNPPYVVRSHFNGLQKELLYEPKLALDGGEDGLDFYRRIIREGRRFLREAGYLILELGFGQAEAARLLFDTYGYKDILFIKDYNNVKRVATAKWTN